MEENTVRAHCPVCKAPFLWRSDSPWRPFCSERCRLIDLGAWLDEGYRIAEETESSAPFLHPEEQ
ncbi:MAG: DNA gyrase inhibitor YacG [Gammaproteobacteria bacterium]|nr:DNA gyrase inhibitor YacG [Gammaproteobacteria bacterium]